MDNNWLKNKREGYARLDLIKAQKLCKQSSFESFAEYLDIWTYQESVNTNPKFVASSIYEHQHNLEMSRKLSRLKQ